MSRWITQKGTQRCVWQGEQKTQEIQRSKDVRGKPPREKRGGYRLAQGKARTKVESEPNRGEKTNKKTGVGDDGSAKRALVLWRNKKRE